MSMSTTCGWWRAAWVTASRPLPASATTSMSGSSASSIRSPARTMDWSSTTSVRIVMASPPIDRKPGPEHEASRLTGTREHVTAEDLHAFADTDQPVPQAVLLATRASTVVAHLDLQLSGAVLDVDVGPGGLTVLQRVREALL